jgi:hypothetical protein
MKICTYLMGSLNPSLDTPKWFTQNAPNKFLTCQNQTHPISVFFSTKKMEEIVISLFSSVNLTNGGFFFFFLKTLHPNPSLETPRISHNAPNRFSNAKIRLNISECILNSQLSNTF